MATTGDGEREMSSSTAGKILVTGANGVLGTHFRAHFGGVPLQDAAGTVDIRNAARVRSAVAATMPDAVLHLAAQSSVAASFENPEETLEVNFLGTLNLLKSLESIGFAGAILYVGSADVYGATDDADLPIRESQPLRPRSPYAVSKVAAEALCYQWSQTHNFRVVLARPFNQIGPGQSTRFAIANFAQQIVDISRGRQRPVLSTGDLDVTRDFTDVRDAVHAYSMLLESGENGEVYNLCSGRERSLRSVLTSLLAVAGIEAELRMDPDRLRPVEQRRVVGDPSKLRINLGWQPTIPLDTTLADILRERKEGSE
jgi:GDP-4-dehydro-6-deoxy-D-mannose reductase